MGKYFITTIISAIVLTFSVNAKAYDVHGTYVTYGSYAKYPSETTTDEQCQQFFDGLQISLDSEGNQTDVNKLQPGNRTITLAPETKKLISMDKSYVQLLTGEIQRKTSAPGAPASSVTNQIIIFLPLSASNSEGNLGSFLTKRCHGFIKVTT